MLIGYGELKSSICSLPGDVLLHLATLIRHPTCKTALGRQVISSNDHVEDLDEDEDEEKLKLTVK
jgi:hypothetical protein